MFTRITTPSDAITSSGPVPAPGRWRRWSLALGLALVPVVLTAAGSAAAQVLALDTTPGVLVVALAAALSALLALPARRLLKGLAAPIGLARPASMRSALWLVPPALTVALALLTMGVRTPAALWLPYLVLVAAVALNEELWFRGLVLGVLRAGGVRSSVVGSAVLFGALHLATLAGGAALASVALQVSFALLFGLCTAQLVLLTGSLWPAITWHAGWDLANYLGGNATDPRALLGLGVTTVVMALYALHMGRMLRRRGSASALPDETTAR